MLKQVLLGTAIVAFGPSSFVSAQEPPKQAQLQPAAKPVPQLQDSQATADFRANFDLAARTLRPSPLAPGSAEIP